MFDKCKHVKICVLQLHSLEEDAANNEVFYRQRGFGPGKIGCLDLSYFDEAILQVVSGPMGQVYHSQSIPYPPGTHVPGTRVNSRSDRAKGVDEASIVDNSIFVEELTNMNLPAFQYENDGRKSVVRAWIQTDSAVESTNPRFVALRQRVAATNRRGAKKIKTTQQHDLKAESPFQKIMSFNKRQYDTIIAEHLTAAGYMANLVGNYTSTEAANNKNVVDNAEAGDVQAKIALSEIFGTTDTAWDYI